MGHQKTQKPTTSIFTEFRVGGELFSNPIIVQQTRYSRVCLVFFIGESTVYGWTVLTELKADPELPKKPAFVISMVGDENKGLRVAPKAY